MCVLTFSVLASALGAIGGGIGAAATAAGSAVTGIGTALGLTGGWATAAGIGVLGAEALSVGATLAGGVASTVSGMQQAEQQAALAEYQASVAEQNAEMANRSAMDNDLQANQKRLALMEQMQQMQGNMRADFAGRGVVLGQGTPNDYEADLADAYDMDRRNLEYDVATKSWQYRVEAHNQNEQAKLYRAQANAARSSIPGIAAGGLLSTAGNLAQSAISSFSLGKEFGLFGNNGGAGSDALLNGAWGGEISDNPYGYMIAKPQTLAATKTAPERFNFLKHK